MALRFFVYVFAFSLALLSFLFVFCRSVNTEEINGKFSSGAAIAGVLLQGGEDVFDDYTFLDSLLKGRSLVVLGGQKLTDGTTQDLYSNLVLHLFEKGYNSLYMEVPFYSAIRLWDDLQSGHQREFPASFYPFWSDSRQTGPLRDSIARWINRDSPLRIKGLDFQIPSVFSQNPAYDDIVSYMRTVPGFAQGELKHLKHSLTNRFGPVLYFNAKGSTMDENRRACLEELRQAQKRIAEKPERTAKDSIYLRHLANIEQFYYAKMYLKGTDYRNHRDSVMFENLAWQMEDTEKAIVWVANGLAANEDSEVLRLGNRVKKRYGDSVLTILSTSFSGRTTDINTEKPQKTNPATILAIESHLQGATGNVSFFVPPEKLKGDRLEMRFYDHDNIESDWFNKMDAFFFIKHMQATAH